MIRHILLALACLPGIAHPVLAEGDWEITPESERALDLGLEWLAKNQGREGNWESNDLGLVGMGALAFLAAGHTPGRGEYGEALERSLDYILRNAKPSGLLNIADGRRDMYNHGLATFVLGQAYGMTNDPRIGPVLDRALKLIANTQCEDGGWDYTANRGRNGHDLSLAVMQAKALRSAVDSGLEVPPEVVTLAIQSVREHFHSKAGSKSEAAMKQAPGQFTYSRSGGGGSPAMAAAGVVCMQEFGQYDDWRIAKSMDFIHVQIEQIKKSDRKTRDGRLPFDAYTLYYIGQALYQVGGPAWEQDYPKLRDVLVQVQTHDPEDVRKHGRWSASGHVSGHPGDLYGTSVACFILAIPNRYLPILQEGKIDSLKASLKSQ